jgi:hypothetical protein
LFYRGGHGGPSYGIPTFGGHRFSVGSATVPTWTGSNAEIVIAEQEIIDKLF